MYGIPYKGKGPTFNEPRETGPSCLSLQKEISALPVRYVYSLQSLTFWPLRPTLKTTPEPLSQSELKFCI